MLKIYVKPSRQVQGLQFTFLTGSVHSSEGTSVWIGYTSTFGGTSTRSQPSTVRMEGNEPMRQWSGDRFFVHMTQRYFSLLTKWDIGKYRNLNPEKVWTCSKSDTEICRRLHWYLDYSRCRVFSAPSIRPNHSIRESRQDNRVTLGNVVVIVLLL